MIGELVSRARSAATQLRWRASDPFWAVEERIEATAWAVRQRVTTGSWSRSAPLGDAAHGAASGCPFHRAQDGGRRVASAATALLRRGPTDEQLQRRIAQARDGAAPGDDVAARKVAREAIGDVFAPLADDVHTELQRLRDLPLEDLPLHGPAPTHGPYDRSPFNRWHHMRLHQVAGERSWFRRLDQLVELRQHVAGLAHSRSHDVVAPVGDHGPALARALVNAGRVVNSVVLGMRPQLDEVARAYPHIVREWTYHKHPLGTFLEATGTYAGTTAVLTHRRVEGMSGMQLLDRLAESNLYQKAAARPVALAGPMFLQGFVPRTAVELSGTGALRPTAAYEQVVDATREMRRARLAQDDPTLTQMELRQTASGCPVLSARRVERADGTEASRQSYIATLRDDYLHLARRFYARELELERAAAATAGHG